MFHSNIYEMTIHVLRTYFPILRAVPLDSVRCHSFIGFFLQVCKRGTYLTCVYIISQALASIGLNYWIDKDDAWATVIWLLQTQFWILSASDWLMSNRDFHLISVTDKGKWTLLTGLENFAIIGKKTPFTCASWEALWLAIWKRSNASQRFFERVLYKRSRNALHTRSKR